MLRVDTGGTFTDGWALDPQGIVHRCKVLSSGLLRARVGAVPDARSLVLEHDLGAGAGVLAGFRTCDGNIVGGWDPAARLLILESAHGLAAGDLLELATGEEAPVVAARLLTGTPPGRAFPPMECRVATTRATNALLERKGTPGLFVTTEGFADLLRIRDQRRAELFAIHQDLPEPLFADSLGVAGRMSPDGGEIERAGS